MGLVWRTPSPYIVGDGESRGESTNDGQRLDAVTPCRLPASRPGAVRADRTMRLTKLIDVYSRYGRQTLRRGNDESAQGVVEFAILIVALMLMFLGVVDFSR